MLLINSIQVDGIGLDHAVLSGYLELVGAVGFHYLCIQLRHIQNVLGNAKLDYQGLDRGIAGDLICALCEIVAVLGAQLSKNLLDGFLVHI